METPIFNLHDMMLVMTGAFSVLLALPMLFRRGGLPQDRLLAQFVLVQGLLALYYLMLYATFSRPTTIAMTVPFQVVPVAILFGLQGPLLLWFAERVAGLPLSSRNSAWISLGIVVLMPVISRGLSGVDRDYGPMYDGIFLTFPALAVSVYYGIRAVHTVVVHERLIKERYSNLETVNLVWLGYVALGFVGVWLIRLSHYLMGIWGLHRLEQLMAIASNLPPLLLIAAMVTLGLSRTRRVDPDDFRRTAMEAAEDSSCRSDVAPSPELVEKLEHLMSGVRLYEDPNLNREGLADSLGVSPRTLSGCINGHFGQTFYEFVNRYRIEAAKTALGDPEKQHHSVQRVFEEAGFNSKSTFNTLFKKSTGMTPSQFRRSRARRLSDNT